MIWHKPSEVLPPQGKKVLCMAKGDFYVAQRFGKWWFPIPFTGSEYAFIEAPELWQDIDPPEPYKGYMTFNCSEDSKKGLSIDEVEQFYPEIYKELIDIQLHMIHPDNMYFKKKTMNEEQKYDY